MLFISSRIKGEGQGKKGVTLNLTRVFFFSIRVPVLADDSGRGAHGGPLIGGKECLAYSAEEPR